MKKVDIFHAGSEPSPLNAFLCQQKRLQTSRVLGERKKADYTGHFPVLVCMNVSGPQPPRCTSESETIPCGFEKPEGKNES